MAVGSGLGSQIGFATETTWGTRVAPTKFIRAKSFQLNREANRVQGEGMAAGMLGMYGPHYVEVTEGATGSLSFDVQTVGMGQLFQAIMGGTSTSVQQAASAAYLQTHTLGEDLKSLTLQSGVPFRSGSVYCEEVTGAKVTSAEFSGGATDPLTCSLSFDARKWDNSQTLAAASYVATAPFHGKQFAVKSGTFGTETSLSGVRSASVSIQNAIDGEDYTAGTSGLKSEQVRNGAVTISGSLSVDWTTAAKTALEDLRIANTPTSLVLEWVGPIIASTYARTFRVVLPGVYFGGDSPAVDGRDVVTVDYSFDWKFDGTNLPKIEYMTTDTSL